MRAKQVPRQHGFQVGSVAKGAAYQLNVPDRDRVELGARKVGGAVKLAEEDRNDAQADPLQAYRTDAATELAKHYDNACLAATAAPDGDTVKYRSHVVADPLGRPPHPEQYSRRFRELVDVAEVRKIKQKHLRSTAATLALEGGVPVMTVSGLLGHARTSTTHDLYAARQPETLAEAVAFLDG